MCFTTELESAKLTALRTLTDILATTEDPIERRRAATAILRLPDPNQNPRGHAGATRAARPASTPEPTQPTPRPSARAAQQIKPKPHDSSPIHPLPSLRDRLPALLNPLPDPLTPPILSPIQSLIAVAGIPTSRAPP